MAKASAASAGGWTQVQIHPVVSVLDTRSRPADIQAGAFRWVQNFQTTPDKKLCRFAGFTRAWKEVLFDALGVRCDNPASHCLATRPDGTADPLFNGVHTGNHDHHHVGGTRYPITYMYECTWGDRTRQLFDGRQDRISVLNEATGLWTDITTGKGSYGSYWTSGFLQDYLIFANDVDPVMSYKQGDPSAVVVAGLTALNITTAKIAVEYNGFIILMNTVEDGKRQSQRVRWSDFNRPLAYDPGESASTLAQYQDLDYGDEILGAAAMLGTLYIYTRRKIWRCVVSGADTVFSFQTVYSEPKNQSGCLAFPRTLTSVGDKHFYMSRDGIYEFSPYVANPVRADWLFRASGVIFTKADTMMTGTQCAAPVGEFKPSTRELWFSWPSGVHSINNYTLVAQIDHQAASIKDCGFSVFCNYRRVPIAQTLCNEIQDFLGASGRDYSIKSIGDDFYRQYVVLKTDGNGVSDPSLDIELADAVYDEEGYNSELRGLIPLGFTDRNKVIRSLLIEDDVTEELEPQNYHVYIGNSFTLQDVNDMDDTCSVMWRDLGTKPVACADGLRISQMQAQHLRPARSKEWKTFDMNKYLYYKIVIEGPSQNTLAKGADVCISSISFDARAQVRP